MQLIDTGHGLYDSVFKNAEHRGDKRTLMTNFSFKVFLKRKTECRLYETT